MFLSNLKKVNGNFVFSNNSFSDFKLKNLEKINEKLQIYDNSNLENLDLSNLDEVGDTVKIENNSEILNITWNSDKEYEWENRDKEITLNGPGSYAWTNTAKNINFSVPLTLKVKITDDSSKVVRIDFKPFFIAIYGITNEQIKSSYNKFNFKINWGDGTIIEKEDWLSDTDNTINHTYNNNGEYKIELVGTKKEIINYTNTIGDVNYKYLSTGIPFIFDWREGNNFNDNSNNIISLEKFGSNIYASWSSTFQDLVNMEGKPTDLPVTAKNFKNNEIDTYSAFNMFNNNSKMNFSILKDLDVSNVNSLNNMFASSDDNIDLVFNQNISSWNVSKVQNMQSLFKGAKNFNQDLFL